MEEGNPNLNILLDKFFMINNLTIKISYILKFNRIYINYIEYKMNNIENEEY